MGGCRSVRAALRGSGEAVAGTTERRAPRGIAVFLLHPGRVATDMLGGQGDIGPDEAAANLLQRMEALTLADTGTFWHANGTTLDW